MRALAGSILFLAASVVLAGGWIAEAIAKAKNYGFGMMAVMAALLMGGLGLAILLSDYIGGRRE
jgi:hypothetical protein